MEWVGGGGWGGFALPSFFTLPSSIGVVGVVGVVGVAALDGQYAHIFCFALAAAAAADHG